MLKNEIQKAHKIVITSRIDNDDAWHKDFVKVIQTRYPTPTKLVEPYQSYWLDLNAKKLYFHKWKWYYRLNRHVGNNPSMIEYRENAKTVIATQHTQLKKLVKWHQFKQITDMCYRLVVCHDQNIVNSIAVGAPGSPQVSLEVLKDFNVILD